MDKILKISVALVLVVVIGCAAAFSAGLLNHGAGVLLADTVTGVGKRDGLLLLW